MAYEKQNFVKDQVLEADHLNHIEDGIATIETELENKQPKGNYLTEHQKMKTINGQSLVGTGNIIIGGGTGGANGMSGKVISILGDSISTYKGYIPVADGFNEEHPSAYPSQDVTKVDYTWWMQVINALGAKLGINDSWSGSRVHNYSTEENPGGNIGTKVCMASMTRITNLGSNGTPDVIFFYGGTNDGKFSTVGTFDSTKVYNTVDLEATTWTSFADAYVAAIMRIQHLYPKARLICITPMFVKAWYDHAVLDKFADIIVEICNYFGVPCIDLRRCGLNYANIMTYLGDGLHPNKAGMTMVANYILAQLKAECLLEEGENVVYSVTNELETVSTDAPQVVGVSAGSAYTVKLSGADDYSGLKVYMGSADVTASALSGSTVSIAKVTGDILISDSGVTPPEGGGDDSGDSGNDNTGGGGSGDNTGGGDEDLGVDLPTETTWYVDFTNEKGNFNYPNGGGAAAHSQPETYNKCVGVPINAVKLMVGNDGQIGYGRVAADGDTYEHLGNIELTGAATTGADAIPQVFKLENTIVLAEGERLAVMEYGGGLPGKIWVSTNSSTVAAQVRTNIRSMGASKDETWKLLIGIGYVVD